MKVYLSYRDHAVVLQQTWKRLCKVKQYLINYRNLKKQRIYFKNGEQVLVFIINLFEVPNRSFLLLGFSEIVWPRM